jgi:dihydrofolate synthase/folylpolyglutamate synthase
MADKDVRGLARELFPPASAIVLTRPRISRAAAPEELARRAGRLAARARRQPSVARALALARRQARADGEATMVVVAGSLYLVGAVKAILERSRRRRRPGQRLASRPAGAIRDPLRRVPLAGPPALQQPARGRAERLR